MSAVDSLSKMQRAAVEQLRAGDHNEILVGFLIKSVMLELSNLPITDMVCATTRRRSSTRSRSTHRSTTA